MMRCNFKEIRLGLNLKYLIWFKHGLDLNACSPTRIYIRTDFDPYRIRFQRPASASFPRPLLSLSLTRASEGSAWILRKPLNPMYASLSLILICQNECFRSRVLDYCFTFCSTVLDFIRSETFLI